MKEMLTRKVEWIEISKKDYYSKGTLGRERTSVKMGMGYTIQDYYADNANIKIEPIDESNDYYYINDAGEYIFVIVYEYFYINFNPYIEDTEVVGTLEQAMKYADKKSCYTQEDILIYGEKENGEYNLIARRRWYNADIDEAEEDENECISYGEAGHYGAWEILDY